jgi:hypothetical protein
MVPRRELLTSAQRFQLFAFPDDESELIRLATLSAEDFAFVRQHRGGHNRLGIAVLRSICATRAAYWDRPRSHMRRSSAL